MAGRSDTKPPSNIEQFKEWAKENISIEFSQDDEKLYNINSSYIKSSFEQTDFFKNVYHVAHAENMHFKSKYKTPLMMRDEDLILYTKPFSSVLDKLFRLNVVWNRNFPNQPKNGWVTPLNMYERIDDIVRGKMVCTYADGPHLLANALCIDAQRFDLNSEYKDRSLDSGYYSVHCYIGFPAEIVSHHDHSLKLSTNIKIEIQITSQLQEIIYNITHDLYVLKRANTVSNSTAWKWEFGTNEFKAGYLGHALHLFEGIIVELRNSSVNEEKTQPKED